MFSVNGWIGVMLWWFGLVLWFSLNIDELILEIGGLVKLWSSLDGLILRDFDGVYGYELGLWWECCWSYGIPSCGLSWRVILGDYWFEDVVNIDEYVSCIESLWIVGLIVILWLIEKLILIVMDMLLIIGLRKV
jgi:hypothetical protein